MGTVIMHSVVSVDGFISDNNDDVGPLHEWYFSGDTPITTPSEPGDDPSGTQSAFRVPRASAPYVRSTWESLGTIVMGRHLFDLVNGWRDSRPQASTSSWCPTVPSPSTGTQRRPTTSSTIQALPSPKRRTWQVIEPSR